MSISNPPKNPEDESVLWKIAFIILLGVIGIMVVALIGMLSGRTPGELISNTLNQLLAANSTQATWYITRAAGLMAYLLVWLSTVWGLAVTSKIFDPFLQRVFSYDFHQFLSLLGIGFVIAHIVVLLADQYQPFSLAQILVPFIAPYRPIWVGIGIIGLYLTLIVTITFYIRRWIGQKTFRVIHYASFIAFIAAAAHGLFSGTDSPLPTVQAMYFVTTLVVVFLTAYRILAVSPRSRQTLAR